MPSLAAVLAADFTVVTLLPAGRGESGDTLRYAIDREIDDLDAIIPLPVADRRSSTGSRRVGWWRCTRPLVALPISSSSRSSSRRSSWTQRAPDTALEREARAARRCRAGAATPRALQPERSASPTSTWRDARGAELARPRGPRPHPRVRLRRSGGPSPPRSRTDPGDPHARIAQRGHRRAAPRLVRRRLRPTSGTARSVRSLPGEWHGVADEVLAPILSEFFLESRSRACCRNRLSPTIATCTEDHRRGR